MPQHLARFGALLAVFLLLPGCGSSTPATGTKGPSGSAGTGKPHSVESFGTVVNLKAISDSSDSKAALTELKQGWASDAETIALLQRLHGGLPVKLEVVQRSEKKPNEMTLAEIGAEQERLSAPPPAGYPIVLRVAFRPPPVSEDQDADPKELSAMLEGSLIAVFAQQPSEKPGYSEDASVGHATLLALNDYLLRKKKGCLIVQDNGWFDRAAYKKLGGDADAWRKYQDEKVEAYAKAFRELWGARGIELK